MEIIVLAENTTECNMPVEHGLSLYIEVCGKKILFDMGETELFSENAKKLGKDIGEVDTAIVSHGHYDHGGGLEKFLQINSKAKVYISRYAFEPHYNASGKYIGLKEELEKSSRLIFTNGVTNIDKGITQAAQGLIDILFTGKRKIAVIRIGGGRHISADKAAFTFSSLMQLIHSGNLL